MQNLICIRLHNIAHFSGHLAPSTYTQKLSEKRTNIAPNTSVNIFAHFHLAVFFCSTLLLFRTFPNLSLQSLNYSCRKKDCWGYDHVVVMRWVCTQMSHERKSFKSRPCGNKHGPCRGDSGLLLSHFFVLFIFRIISVNMYFKVMRVCLLWLQI